MWPMLDTGYEVLGITSTKTICRFIKESTNKRGNVDVDVVVINGQRQLSPFTSEKSSEPLRHENPNDEIMKAISDNSQQKKQDKQLVELELFPELVIPGLGDGGSKAILPDKLRNLSAILFNNHSFDSVLSDHISMNRKLPDARGRECEKKDVKYSKDLPTTSVIICFHNEALSVLVRTVQSVFRTTPTKLIADVILVDDASLYEYTKKPLDYYVSNLNQHPSIQNKIKIIRNEKRDGLVRSRLKGAEISTGDVLTFLDSHCETTIGWMEPLLDRIRQDKRNVVCPVIEVIDASDFSYKGSKLDAVTQVGSFTWDLFFTWKELSTEERKTRKDNTEPLRSPTMAGGLFAIDKKYFYEIGSYDQQMDIWGGENLEMSFRIWMCGGSLEIVPCSRVGHIFRKENSPYTFPDGVSKTLTKNFNRLAEVWMDEYKELYYRRKQNSDREVDIGSLEEREKLRASLGCKNFKWYLDNIIPDLIGSDPRPPAHGELRNLGNNRCVDSMGSKAKRSHLKLHACHGMGGNQYFVLSKRGEVIFNDENCLDYSSDNKLDRIEMWECHGLKGNQEWKHDKNEGYIKHAITGNCLALDEKDEFLVAAHCTRNSHNQKWKFEKYDTRIW